MASRRTEKVLDRFDPFRAPYVKECARVWIAVLRRQVPGMPGPIKKGTRVGGYEKASKPKLQREIADAYANGDWPKGSMKVVRVINCLRGQFTELGRGRRR